MHCWTGFADASAYSFSTGTTSSSQQANLHRGSHDPGQDFEAGQSLPACAVRSGGLGGAGQAKERERLGLDHWLEAAKKRLHRNVLAVALANKLARIAWSVLAQGRTFQVGRLTDGLTA
jgi:hypothetical protein